MDSLGAIEGAAIAEDLRRPPGRAWPARRGCDHGVPNEVELRATEELDVQVEDVLRDADHVRHRRSPPRQSPGSKTAEQRTRSAGFGITPGQRHARTEQVVVVEAVHHGQAEPAAGLPDAGRDALKVVCMDNVRSVTGDCLLQLAAGTGEDG